MSAADVRAAVESAFRDFTTEGVPASGLHEPVKADIRYALGILLQLTLEAAGAGMASYATVAARDADTARPSGTLGYVYRNNGLTTDAANGFYQWTGSAWEAAGWLSSLIAGAVDAYLPGRTFQPGTLAERGAIPSSQLKDGLMFYVTDITPKRMFEWSGGAWVGLFTQSELRNRAAHTGTQSQETIVGLPQALSAIDTALGATSAGAATGDAILQGQVDKLASVKINGLAATALSSAAAPMVDVSWSVRGAGLIGQTLDWGGWSIALDASARAVSLPADWSAPPAAMVMGDSLSDGGTWVEYLAPALGIQLHRVARYAQSSRLQALRSGAVPIYLTLAGNNLPAGGTAVAVTEINGAAPGTDNPASFLNTFPGDTVTVGNQISGTIAGRHVTISIPTGGSNAYRMTADAGSTAVTVPPKTLFVPDFAAQLGRAELWIAVGRNNLYQPDQVRADIDAIVRRARGQRIIIFGVLNASTEGTGTSMLAQIKAFNSDLKWRYPQYYAVDAAGRDLRERLLAAGGATGDDATDRANEVIPRSLRTDDLHPNAAGNQVWAAFAAEYRALQPMPPAITAATIFTLSASGQDGLGVVLTDGATAQVSGGSIAALGTRMIDPMTTATTRWVRQVAAIETGYVYSPINGARSASAGYWNAVLALTGDELRVRATAKASGSGNALACYFDASDTFISADKIGNNTAPSQWTNQSLTVPSAARKVVVCGLKSAPIGIDILTMRTLATTDARASAGNAAAATLAPWTASGATIINGYFITDIGVPSAVAGYQYLDYTLADSDIAFRATGTENGGGTALATYVDVNGQVIGRQFVGTGSNVAYANQALTVPDNTVKIRVCGISSGALSLDVQRVISNAAATIANNSIGASQGAAAASSLSAWQTSGAPVTDGYYISSTGVATALAGYKYLDYTLTGSEVSIRATATEQGNATALATYIDAGGAVISRQFVGTGSNVAYANQALTVPAGTVKIRVCGITSGALSLDIYSVVPGVGTKLMDAMAGNQTGRAIAVVGDSTAALVAPFVATNNPARVVYDQGLGGQTTAQIAARMGAAQVTLGAFTMPTTGSVAVTPSIDLLFLYGRPSAISCRVIVMGIACTLTCAITTGAYTLTPLTYPAATMAIPAGTTITVTSGIAKSTSAASAPSLDLMLAGNVLVRTGRNDIGGSPTQTQLLTNMGNILGAITRRGGRAMLATVTNGNYDMPTSSGLPGAAVSTAAISDARLAAIDSLNTAMLAAWPDQVIDVQAYHVASGGATARAPVSVTYQVLDVPTMATDGLHESSATGLPRMANFVQAIINGWGR